VGIGLPLLVFASLPSGVSATSGSSPKAAPALNQAPNVRITSVGCDDDDLIAPANITNANDLASVASGQKLPWEVRPYAVWPLSLPFSTIGSTRLGGAAFDPQTRRLFISQLYADNVLPVVHVFTISLQ
jgi:hypothetical protein